MQQAQKSGPRHLSPKVKTVWFAPTGVALFVLWVISSAFLVLSPLESTPFSMPKILLPVLSFVAIAVLLAAPIIAYHHVEYMSFTYELGPEELIIREGVITRDTTVIPYTRVQNITTKRTLIERLLGLATLQIETAGTNVAASEGLLPGIENKEALIAEILGHVELAKRISEAGAGAAAQSELKALKGSEALLAEILKELVHLNKTISNHYGRLPNNEHPGRP